MTDDLFAVELTPDEQEWMAIHASQINVARRVLSRRLDLGLSQDALAKAAGTTQARISRLEAMEANPNFDTLDRIARALGLVVDLVNDNPTQELACPKMRSRPFR